MMRALCCMQEWEDDEVMLCKDGELDDTNGLKIAIDDEIQRVRSQQAEDISQKYRAQYPLPQEARNGGQMRADPGTMAFKDLTTRMPRVRFGVGFQFPIHHLPTTIVPSLSTLCWHRKICV